MRGKQKQTSSTFVPFTGKDQKKPYFITDNFVLYKEDCLELLRKIKPNSIDMVFADPPYNLSNGGITVHAGRQVSVNKGQWDASKGFKEDFAFHKAWIKAVKRVLKPEGTLWISGTYHSIYQCGYALQLMGYKVLNDITWYKPNASPNLTGRNFAAAHESLIWAKKDEKAKHVYNYKLMKEGHWPKDSIKNPGKQMRSVWSIGTPLASEKKMGKHPTQKPMALLERIVLASTKEDALILDPFTGSSTTGVAAALHDRRFIGIDTDKSYLELSKKRYEAQSKATEERDAQLTLKGFTVPATKVALNPS